MATVDSHSDQLIGEPLDLLQMQVNTRNGDINTVSALHIGFMEVRKYVHFKPPPNLANDTGQNDSLAEEEEWLELATFLKEDLHWVLRLPYHRFWSQVIYDEGLHKCLESYLSQAPRYYDLDNLNLKPEVSHLLKKIHKLIFLIYLRMSTFKESKRNHMRPAAFAEIIYDNFIFDVPKIMDLSVLYGLKNLPIMSRMIQNIFSNQPAYFEDLDKTSKAVLEAFNTIEEKLSKNFQEIHGTSSTFLVNGVSIEMEFTLSAFYDIINYITDVSATLHAFLEVYSDACQTFYQNGATLRLATFYEMFLPAIEREIARRCKLNENEKILKDIKRKVSLSKTLLIKIFRSILNFCCIQNIFSLNSSGKNSASSDNMYSERFLEIFTELASNKNFMHDYNFLYPFESDVELFNELNLNLDSQRLSYIFFSIHDTVEDIPQTFVSSVANGARPKVKKTDSLQKSTPSFNNAADILRKDCTPEESLTNGATVCASNSERTGLTDFEMNSLVESIREVLGDCDKRLIKNCLEYFDYDPNRTIDAIVTDNLPQHLKSDDKTFEKELTPEAETNSNNSILLERKSIFDNDEFDVFRRKDVNMENIHIGKKSKTPSKYENLSNDKEFEILKKYTLACGSEETAYVDDAYLYEDEYDDTYDSAMVGLKEPVPEGEPDVDTSEDKKNVEPVSTEKPRDTSRDFCEDPVKARERYNQKREAKMTARGGRRDAAPVDQNHSRQNKDRNKKYAGNHNRRKQSDFKQSRGMMRP